MNQLFKSGILAAALFSSTAVLANGFYIGGTIGQTRYGIDDVDKPTSFEFFGGYQFHKHYAIEIAYNEFGEGEGNRSGVEQYVENQTLLSYPYNYDVSIEGRSLSSALKLIVPLSDRVNFYAKAGFHYWDLETTSRGYDTRHDRFNMPINFNEKKEDNDTELLYGVGFDAKVVHNFYLGLRYTSFQADSDERMKVFGLSGYYYFNFK